MPKSAKKVSKSKRREGYQKAATHKRGHVGSTGIETEVSVLRHVVQSLLQVGSSSANYVFDQGVQFAEGLAEGILMAGEQLKEHFPYTGNDINELSDTISFDITEPGL